MNNPQEHRDAANHMPRISVVLPVYNGEKYLAEAIDSILAQSFKDFELIMIDDGSTDGSLKILQQFQKRDPRVRLVARENRNLATTLNDSIDLARGNWIARMDQDDIALPHRFERQLHWLDQTGADITGSWIKPFGTSGSHVLKHPQTDAAIKMEMLFGAPFAHPSVMMRSVLAKRLRYDKTWEGAEDYEIWVRAAQNGWLMTNVPEVLLMYRQHDKQISTKASLKQQKLGQQIRRKYWLNMFDTSLLSEECIDEVLKLREPILPKVNMNVVDEVFTTLLNNCHGESREVVFDHITKLYFRVASSCPDIVSRWGRLNKKFGNGFALETKLSLWLVNLLKINPSVELFSKLKRYLSGFIQ
jgi:glycosyltransferase involved in cell wall biosynthesis